MSILGARQDSSPVDGSSFQSNPFWKVKCGRLPALLMESQDIGRNAVCDSLRCLVNRSLRQMGIRRRRLDVTVAEQLADPRQGLSERQRTGREVVP